MIDRTFSIAPMLDWTDRHARYFFRLFSPNILLYTEMVTSGALLFGDRARFLAHHPAERPLAIQLGGSHPDQLAQCAEFAEASGYQEVNLNVGCPSDRVQSGQFGACLMAKPDLVASCVASMSRTTRLPVTVKCRIGIDHDDSYGFFRDFVDTVAAAGCRTFIVHARKAWLNGLSPRQNREIPPLHYETVYRLKQERPELEVVINGGVRTLDDTEAHLQYVDGVMIGREAFQNPAILLDIDQRLFGARDTRLTRETVLNRYMAYVESELAKDVYLKHLTPPLFGLFHGLPGTKAWKRHLSENAYRSGAGVKVLVEAAERAFDLKLAA